MNLEVETKLSAAFDFVLPELDEVVSGLHITKRPSKRTYTTYFDTGDYDLLSCGAALRFRSSQESRTQATGTWTLKFAPPTKGFKSSRFEFEVQGQGSSVPQKFIPALGVFGATGPLVEVAVLFAVRSSAMFEVADGRPVIELDDDVVEVIEGPNRGNRFREIELELLDASFEDAAEDIAGLLVSQGACYATSASKLEQAIDNPGNHAWISGLLDRYEHPVVGELSRLASLLLGEVGGRKVLLKRLAAELLIGLKEDSAREFIVQFVSRVALGGSLYREDADGLFRMVADVSISLATELRNGVGGKVTLWRPSSLSVRRACETVLANAALMRRDGRPDASAFTELLDDIVSLPWGELSQGDEALGRFLAKWS